MSPQGRARHDRTTASAPRAAAHGHVHFDRDRGLPHLRPHDDARDRHARVAVSVTCRRCTVSPSLLMR